MLTISAVCDEHGQVKQYVGLLLDISEMKDQEYKLQRLAHYDALTQLPNRPLLSDRLQQAMALATRNSQRVAVCYLEGGRVQSGKRQPWPRRWRPGC